MKLPRWRLFPKYAMLITAVVAGVLVISGAINLVFSWRETQAQLVALQMEKAQGAAVRIEQYVLDIERQIAWTAFPRIDPSVDATEQRRFEYLKLQKQAPAITEMVWIGPDGRERLRMSRLGLDVIGAGTDWSKEPGFIAVLASMRAGKGEAWYGPVQFRKETEPYMAIARPAGGDGGVTLVDVNLKFVWDVVSRIKIGQNGLAYAVDATGTLIAHPDISLVLKHTDLSSLPQVAALAHPDAGAAVDARDLAGQPVFVAHARIPALNWTVFVESPRAEALAPLRESIMRLLWLLVGGLLLAAAESFVLARALVRPIRALQEGAARIGAGELDQRIRIKTGDELEGLAEQFNKMGAELQASYAGLERKVEERTRELRDALEQQTATAEVLQVISGSVADATPVFDKILESCERLFDCSTLVVNLIGDDSVAQLGAGGLLHLVAHRPPSDAQDGLKSLYPMRLGDTATEMAIRERRVLNFSDVLNGEGVPEGAPVPARLRGYSYSQMVAPLMWDERGIGSISVIRGRLGGFTQKECDLLKTFADQAVIAIQNSRLFNETKEALERQTATAEILRVISGSPTNVQPVLDTVAERSGALCRAEGSRVWLLQGGKLCAMTSYGSVYADDAREALPLGRGSVAARAFVDRALVHVQDVLPLIDSEYPDVRHLQARYGFRTVLAVPMLREGESVGVIALLRNEVRLFSAAEIALVRAFADQAVIAIENVRLFNETKEALERQTATSEVLRVISESPADVQPVMDAVAERARLLCKAQGGRVWLPEGDRLRSITGYKLYKLDDGSDAGRGETLPLRSGSVVGRAFVERRIVQVDDVQALLDTEYPDSREVQHRYHFRSILAVPLLREGVPLGVIGLARKDVRPFAESEIELVQTFADQAVIAIENVRLFNETKEALERQTATSEVLRVISESPSNVQPVLDAVAERARVLCKAQGSRIWLPDGDRLRSAIGFKFDNGEDVGHGEAWPLTLPMKLSSVAGRAFIERRIVQVDDIEALLDEYPDSRTHYRFRTTLAVPLLREGVPLGVIGLSRKDVRPFVESEIELVQTFADQAVIAIENVRLFNETKEALEQQTATAEVLRVISSSVADTAPVFEKILHSCSHLFESSEQGIVLMGDDGRLHLGAHRGTARDKLAAMFPITGGDEPVARAMAEQRVLHYADVLRDAEPESLSRQVAENLGVGSYTQVFAPMRWEGQGVGYLYVIRSPVAPFSDKEIGLLKTFADQAAIAIQNARLFNEIENKSRQLEAANRHKSEFLANMSHELRTPLNAIIGFSEVLTEKMFGEVNDKQMEYLQDIHSSGQHLLALINDVLDLSKIEAGKMELDLSCFDLGLLLEHSATLVRERAQRHGLALELEVGDGLAEWVADARKVKQVVVNLLSNAVKFTPNGGRVSVRARHLNGMNGHAGEWAEVSVSDTGVGIAPQDQALVFEEFRQAGGDVLRKAEGTGLGLALVKRFVELHGGMVTLDSEPGHGSTFRFTLPQHEVKVLQ